MKEAGPDGASFFFMASLDDQGGQEWTWDGTSWTEHSTPGGRPSPRYAAAMAYDSARGLTVLFGGAHWDGAAFKFYGDTWEWDGADWTLRATTGPTLRGFSAMTYDGLRGVVVLFGGTDLSGPFDDTTWEWDGDSWVQYSVSGPSGRYDHAMAYDVARGRTVLFGGGNGWDSYYDDTWEWDGLTWNLCATSGPSARAEHALAYSDFCGSTILFGGCYIDLGQWWEYDYDDTWEWDGSSWTQSAFTGPVARCCHRMAYDAGRNQAVLFGGYNNDDAGFLGDTWELGTLVGDLNCDGHVGFGDINPFVLYLSNFGGWQAMFPGCPPQNGDINADGTYGQWSFGDINPFVALLTGN
jgi:hypothetical protein